MDDTERARLWRETVTEIEAESQSTDEYDIAAIVEDLASAGVRPGDSAAFWRIALAHDISHRR